MHRVGSMRALSFDEVDAELVSKLLPACSTVQALSISSLQTSLVTYGLKTQWKCLQFLQLHISPGQQIKDLYKSLGSGIVEVINTIFAEAPRLVGLQLPIPKEDSRPVSWEISLDGVNFPDQFLLLGLISHCPGVHIDLRKLDQLALRHLCLVNIFISPLEIFDEVEPSQVNLNVCGPRLYIGGLGKQNTINVLEHIVLHRP